MKTLLLASLLLFCTTAALGQASLTGSVLNNQPIVLQVPSHPQQAIQKPLAEGQSLLENTGYFHADGKRPLWEVAVPKPAPMPLGDVARILRKEHETAKKASVVMEN